MIKANQVKFSFACGEFPASAFAVRKFTGSESISSLFEFEITFRCTIDGLSPGKFIAQPGTFSILRESGNNIYKGIVSRFTFLEQDGIFAVCRIILVPDIYQLSMNFRSRVFQNADPISIVKQVFRLCGLEKRCRFEIGRNYPVLEYCVQYQESDLNFVTRIMEQYGIWFFFLNGSQGEQEEELLLTDQYTSFLCYPEVLPLVDGSGFSQSGTGDCVSAFQSESTLIPKRVGVRSVNYRSPETVPEYSQEVNEGHLGEDLRWGGPVKSVEDAQFFAELSARRYAVSASRIEAKGTCSAFRAGMLFKMDAGEMRKGCSGKYLITSVYHEGGAVNGGTSDVYTYRNRFIGIASSNLFVPELKATRPKIPGVITAPIEALGENYATLDEMGRYRVRMPFDVSDSPMYGASKQIRLSQPSSGSDTGIHFPSKKGAEMILACIDGDPDKPLGLGTIPNAAMQSPVRNENRHQNIIRTGGGNEFIMDDSEGKQKVRLCSAGRHEIEMDDETKIVSVKSSGECRFTMDDENRCAIIEAGKHRMNMVFKDGENCVTVTTGKGHRIIIDDEKNTLILKTSGGNVISMDDGKNTLSIEDSNQSNKIALDGSGKLVMESSGEIQINAQKDVVIKGANVKMTSVSGNTEIKASSDVNVNAVNIGCKASGNLKASALQTSVSGSVGMKISSPDVVVKGDMSVRVSAGAKAEISGGAMASLKGAMVMIN